MVLLIDIEEMHFAAEFIFVRLSMLMMNFSGFIVIASLIDDGDPLLRMWLI